MLPKNRRIPRKIFPTSIKGSLFYTSKSLSLKVYKSTDSTKESRISFVTSQKTSKKATERNLLRRRGYSVVNSLLTQIKPAYLLIFSVKKEALELSFEQFKAEIEDLLKKAGVLN
jgi:ribonuclease P protein component